MNSGEIVALLRKKHEEDVFVAECKDGPSTWGSHLRMDAWAMKKSWANPCATAYEVKVSRGDFLRDDKWRGYLAYCNEFYFVCPDGVIRPEEVPEAAGLLWVAKTGTQLRKRKRAPNREVAIPESLYRYLLFSRTRVDPPSEYRTLHERKDRAYWENWLREKKDDLSFGWSVGRRIREVIEERIRKVESESRALKDENARLQEVEGFLKSIGLTGKTHWLSLRQVRNRLEELNQVFSPGILTAVEKTLNGLSAIKDEVARRQWQLKDESGQRVMAED